MGGGTERMKRILVTEDEPEIRMYLRMLLEGDGFSVEEAEDGAVALHKLATERFDMMLLDLMMPNVDGFEVLARLTPEQRERLPIVVVTACDSDTDVVRGYSLGAAYYITKPYENRAILNIVNYLFGNLTPDQRGLIERYI